MRRGCGESCTHHNHTHVGGTRGSGILSSAADVLWISVVRGMKGVGEVCEMCLARGGVGGEDERIGFGLYLSCQNRESFGRVHVFCLQ